MNKTAKRLTRIGVFRGDWGFLSNFSPVEVKLYIDSKGVPWSIPSDKFGRCTSCGLKDYHGESCTVEVYASVEHAYQAAKFLDAKIRERFRLPGLSPEQAKNMAKYLRTKGLVRPDWEEVSLDIMRGLLVQKFTYSILRRKLLSTFGAELVEGNWWCDNFFGNCLCPKCENIPGQNHLGRLLMEIRQATITPPSKSSPF
jgi:ribA/ribD-fused uncharacterized protein